MKIEVNDELKKVIREVIKESLEEEMMKLRLFLTPYVSDNEQNEIEENYKKPSEEVVRKFALME